MTTPESRRFLTPQEAIALSGPVLQEEIARANKYLVAGDRELAFKRPLWPVIRAGLEAAGWECEQIRDLAWSQYVWVHLLPAPADEAMAAAYEAVAAEAPALRGPTNDERPDPRGPDR